MSLSFSKFNRYQLTFEAKFDEAYKLWDEAGTMWSAIRPIFDRLDHNNVSPNQQVFVGDDRYVMAVSLDKLAITDNSPNKADDSRNRIFELFFRIAAHHLQLDILTRVGTRIISHLPFSDKAGVIKTLSELGLVRFPQGRHFDIDPKTVTPTYIIEGDDGELGYRLAISPSTRSVDLTPNPDIADLVTKLSRVQEAITVDTDFYTLKPVEVGVFRITDWLTRWERVLARDMDKIFMMSLRDR